MAEQRPYDQMDYYRWLQERMGPQEANKYYQSKINDSGQSGGMMDKNDPRLEEYLRRNISKGAAPTPAPLNFDDPAPVNMSVGQPSSIKPEPFVIGDVENQTTTRFTSSPGSAFLQTIKELSKGGKKIPPDDKKKISFKPDTEPKIEEKAPAAQPLPPAPAAVAPPPPPPPPEPAEPSADLDFLNRIPEQFSDAQQRANDARFIAGMGEAALTVGTQGRASDSDKKFFRDIAARGDNYSKELSDFVEARMNGVKLEEFVRQTKDKRRLDAEGNDPNSSTSKNYRDIWRSVYPNGVRGVPNFDKMSAVQLKEYGEAALKTGMLSQQQADALGLKYGEMAQRGLENEEERRLRIELEKLKNQGRIDVKSTPQGGGKGGVGSPAQARLKAEKNAKIVSGLNTINEIRGLKKKVDTGPLAGWWMTARNAVGKLGGDAGKLKQLLDNTLMLKVNEVAATTFTPNLVEQVRQMLPSQNDDDAEFNQKLDSIDQLLRETANSWYDSMEAGGQDMGNYRALVPAAGAAGSSAPISPITPKSNKKPINEMSIEEMQQELGE